MIIDQTNTEVIGVETTDFKIVASSKAFKILGDSLYQNKQEAVIRELSTNALDAQKEAGSDCRYELHIPTNLDPEFRIRDFGTGLDSEQIEGLYTTYFQSTKDQSNEYIGALGLGSKSPFSCTKEFTVTSYKDGMMYVYLIKTVNDKPTYSKLLEHKTDEPNGVEIKFQTEDIYKFQRAYQKVISGFDPIHHPVCNIKLDYELQEILDGVYSSRCHDHDRINIRMGQILYPLYNKIDNYIRDDLFDKFGYRIVIDVPLGSVDIHPSRESLDFTNKTNEFLKEHLYQTQEKLLENIRDQINEKDTIRQAGRFVQDLGFPLSLFSYKETNLSVLSELYNKAQQAAGKLNLGYIESNKAVELISPRLKYSNKIHAGLFRRIILVIRTKIINITNTLKHLSKAHNCVILVVDERNHTLIGMLKKTYQEDLTLYTTCNKDLRKSVDAYKAKKESTKGLVKIVSVFKKDNRVCVQESEIERDQIKDQPNTFSGKRSGNTVTVEYKDNEFYVVLDGYSSYRSILKHLLSIYGDFTIILGVNNKKYIECLSKDFFDRIYSGNYSTLSDLEMVNWNKAGFNLGKKTSLENSYRDFGYDCMQKVDEICVYKTAAKENELVAFVINNLRYKVTEEADRLLDKLKELL